MTTPTKKTPSPKVIASYMIREMFANVGNFTAENLASLVSSRVSEEKREKVMDQFKKVTLKFAERIAKTIEKHETPPKKSKADKAAAKAAKLLKKGKKKKNRD